MDNDQIIIVKKRNWRVKTYINNWLNIPTFEIEKKKTLK